MAKIASFCLAFVVIISLIETSSGAVNIIDIYRNVVFDYAVMKNPKPVVVFYYSSRLLIYPFTCNLCKCVLIISNKIMMKWWWL